MNGGGVARRKSEFVRRCVVGQWREFHRNDREVSDLFYVYRVTDTLADKYRMIEDSWGAEFALSTFRRHMSGTCVCDRTAS